MNAKEFLMNLPANTDKAVVEGHNTRFHFILSGDETTEVTLSIVDGELTAEEGLCGEPKCVVRASSENLMKIVNKDLNPMMAVLMGKLKMDNQGEMLKYAKILGLM